MNTEQLEKIATGSGFIAALDQSGGSTPKRSKHMESKSPNIMATMKCLTAFTKCEPG